jgi:hypothetical protein
MPGGFSAPIPIVSLALRCHDLRAVTDKQYVNKNIELRKALQPLSPKSMSLLPQVELGDLSLRRQRLF